MSRAPEPPLTQEERAKLHAFGLTDDDIDNKLKIKSGEVEKVEKILREIAAEKAQKKSNGGGRAGLEPAPEAPSSPPEPAPEAGATDGNAASLEPPASEHPPAEPQTNSDEGTPFEPAREQLGEAPTEPPQPAKDAAPEALQTQLDDGAAASRAGAMTIVEATTLRLQLVQRGHIPVPLYGKEPPIYGKNNKRKGLTEWTALCNVTRQQIEMWAKTWPDAVNTGALTRRMPTLDFDIESPEAVRACVDYVREHYETEGYILTRTGKPPRCAIPLPRFLSTTSFSSADKI